MLCGGGLGNAVLFSIGAAFRAAGSKVLYFAGYKKVADRYKVADIEKAADAVIWCCDEEPGFKPGRPQDRSFVGNIVQAMDAYAEGRLGAPSIRLEDADRLIAIGSDRMMAAVARARHDVLKPHLKPRHFAIGSINSPMQCMMKEICAQCLQPHRDPRTGEDQLRLLLLQPGPAARQRGLQGPQRAPEAELARRKTERRLAEALHARPEEAAQLHLGGRLTNYTSLI